MDYYTEYKENETENKLLEMYYNIHLGDCDICKLCHQEENLSMPVSSWFVGKDFFQSPKRILFVGKNARGYQDEKCDVFQNVFRDGRDLWQTKKSWPYWGYTSEITKKIFGDDSPEHIAFTNIVKCNGSHDRDTTSDAVKKRCIMELRVLSNEIMVIRPTHVIFYTAWGYDTYIPKVFDSFEVRVDTKKTVGAKTMPWLEADAEINDTKVCVLRIGHPERKEKENFVNLICEWINQATN